jgi:hypothetical protein
VSPPDDTADDATPASDDEIRPEDIPFDSPPPPPPPPDADPRFDDKTRAVYRVILNDHQLDKDMWRAVEYACTWWDEDKPSPSRYHDDTTLREHAADAIEWAWTALAETARESDDPGPLGILAEHDVEGVDWHLIAEHVLHHDGRGHLRTWAHEIPYDPFTPPQLDRSIYRSAEDRDRLSARELRPPSPADNAAGGMARSVADELVANIETQELLVDRVDVQGARATETVPSPTPGGDGAAPNPARTAPARDNTGREDAPHTPHYDTADGGHDWQSRAPDEPSLDPWLTNREPTKVQEAPAPTPESTSGKKLPAAKRMPEVKPPDPTRAPQGDKQRDNARTTDRDTHGRDDGGARDNAPVITPPEPVIPPPPPPEPEPEPEPDYDFDM